MVEVLLTTLQLCSLQAWYEVLRIFVVDLGPMASGRGRERSIFAV